MATRGISRLAGAVRDKRGRIVKPTGGDAVDAGSHPNDSGSGDSVDSGSSVEQSAGPIDPGTGFAQPAQPVRRGRGRPRNSERGTETSGKPRSSRAQASKEVAVTSGTLTDTIVEIHQFLSDLTDIKRLEMERDKAGKLARALHNANQHVKIPMLNSRNAALAMLAWTAGRIYLPMAKDVVAEMSGAIPPSSRVAKAEAERIPSASVSEPVTVTGNIVPVSAEDAALESWLPNQVN